MKHGAPDHRKMKALARLLKIPLYAANGIMERLWHATAEYAPNGGIGIMANDEIADHCATLTDFDPDEFVTALIRARFLDELPLPDRLGVHDWSEHADYYTHRKIARRRQFFADGNAPKLTRLYDREREELEEFYGSEHGRPNQQNGRPTDAQRTPETAKRTPETAKRTPPCARAVPEPEPEPLPLLPLPEPHKSAAGKNGRRKQQQQFSKTAQAIRELYPETDDAFIDRLCQKCKHEATEAGLKSEIISDELLSRTVKRTTKKNQTSAGLYMKTVPQTIRTWARTEAKR